MPNNQEQVLAEEESAFLPIARALAGLAALAVAMGIGRFAFTPILPMMQQDAGLSVAAGGWLASANYLGYLIGALTVGRMKIGSAIAIRGGLVLTGLVTLGMGLTQSFTAWVLLRTVAGFTSAWVLVCVLAWSMEMLTPLRRPILGAIVFAGVGTGIAAAGGLCLALLHAGMGSVAAWILLGSGSLVIAALLWSTFAIDVQSAPMAKAAATRSRWPAGSLLLIVCYGIFGFGYIIPATFLPAMAREVIQDPAVFGWSWPVFGAAAVLSTLLAAVVLGSFDNRRVWIVGHLVMAAGVVLPAIWTGMTAILIAALCVGGTFMVITMAAMQEAREVAGARIRPLLAAMTSAFALGQIAGPLVVSGLAGTRNGFALALALAGVLLGASALALVRRKRA